MRNTSKTGNGAWSSLRHCSTSAFTRVSEPRCAAAISGSTASANARFAITSGASASREPKDCCFTTGMRKAAHHAFMKRRCESESARSWKNTFDAPCRNCGGCSPETQSTTMQSQPSQTAQSLRFTCGTARGYPAALPLGGAVKPSAAQRGRTSRPLSLPGYDMLRRVARPSLSAELESPRDDDAENSGRLSREFPLDSRCRSLYRESSSQLLAWTVGAESFHSINVKCFIVDRTEELLVILRPGTQELSVVSLSFRTTHLETETFSSFAADCSRFRVLSSLYNDSCGPPELCCRPTIRGVDRRAYDRCGVRVDQLDPRQPR